MRRLLTGTVLVCSLGLAGCAQNQAEKTAFAAPRAAGQSTVDALVQAGDEARLRGELDNAATLYRSAHRAAPQDPVPLVRLGEILATNGAAADAAQAFRKALRFNGRDADALRGLGNVLIILDQSELAVPYFQRALEIAPEDVRIYLGLGVAYDLGGDHEAARAMYDTGLRHAPDDPDLLANNGLSFALSDDHEAAIEFARLALESDKATHQHRLLMALVYGLAGHEDAARDISTMDFDQASIERNLSYFRTLRALDDPAKRLRAIRAFFAGADS